MRDINQTPASSWPTSFAQLGDRLLFIATSPLEGRELWSYDKSSKRATRLSAVPVGPKGTVARLVTTQSSAFFIGNDFDDLFTSDGKPEGTRFVKDITPGRPHSTLGELTPLNDVVIFRRVLPTSYELWRSDGTPAGTVPFFQLPWTIIIHGEQDGVVYFGDYRSGGGRSLWRTDGTTQGTWIVARVELHGEAVVHDGDFFFLGSDGTPGLWRSDGTVVGTYQVVPVGDRAREAQTDQGLLYFFTRSEPMTDTLWRSDGTAPGTERVLDVEAPVTANVAAGKMFRFGGDSAIEVFDLSPHGADPREPLRLEIPGIPGESWIASRLVYQNSVLLAVAHGDDANLWITDGTHDGTTSLAKFGHIGPFDLTLVGDLVYFSATDEEGREPWVTDGTLSGTHRVTDVARGNESSTPSELVQLRGTIYFAADDGVFRRELWESDGSAAGTRLRGDIASGPHITSSSPKDLSAVGDKLLFHAENFTYGRELISLDTVARSFTYVADITSGSFISSSAPSQITVSGSRVWFTQDDQGSINGRELWLSDGTADGTRMVADLRPGASSSTPLGLTAFGESIIFSADTPETGRELWISGGDTISTNLIADLTPGTESSAFGEIVAFGSVALFAADDGGSGLELWSTDGGATNTNLVRDIAPGPAGSSPRSLHVMGDEVFFVADEGQHGSELWHTRGSANDTSLLRDIHPGSEGSSAAHFVDAGGTTYFTADDGEHGNELWRTDGTSDGTWMVADIVPGASGSNPTYLQAAFGNLMFQACDQRGCEVWMSDGTANGTLPLAEIFPGPISSSPGPFFPIGDAVYFSAAAPEIGYELWRVPGADLGLCVGDCNYNGEVTISEIILTVKVMLGARPSSDCSHINRSSGITQAIRAVTNALDGCG